MVLRLVPQCFSWLLFGKIYFCMRSNCRRWRLPYGVRLANAWICRLRSVLIFHVHICIPVQCAVFTHSSRSMWLCLLPLTAPFVHVTKEKSELFLFSLHLISLYFAWKQRRISCSDVYQAQQEESQRSHCVQAADCSATVQAPLTNRMRCMRISWNVVDRNMVLWLQYI